MYGLSNKGLPISTQHIQYLIPTIHSSTLYKERIINALTLSRTLIIAMLVCQIYTGHQGDRFIVYIFKQIH